MAKINKYWGMVALGAATAAVAGAVAAAFAKRHALEEAADLEDDFEDEQEDDEQPEAKDVHEDFVTWEATSEDEKMMKPKALRSLIHKKVQRIQKRILLKMQKSRIML